MTLALGVGLASGLGAVARYVLDQVIGHQHDSVFPYGTFTVNVTGSLLLGLISGLSVHAGLPTGPTVVLSAGFCSGFTTWSTFAYETLALAESGARRHGALNVLGSLVAGLAAAALGLGLALAW